MWNDSTVTPAGKCKLDATTKNGKKHKVEFIVVDEELTPLVGRETAEKMGLVAIDYRLVAKVEKETANVATRNDIVKRYPDVFGSALGTLPGKVHLVTDPEAQPKAVTGCRVPVSVKPQLATMLQQMEERRHNKSGRADGMGEPHGDRNKEGRRLANLHRPASTQQSTRKRTASTPRLRRHLAGASESKGLHKAGSPRWILAVCVRQRVKHANNIPNPQQVATDG
ncbi:unnamed protein product [Ixodes pacificus]